MKKVGLALASGGARGLAHIGVIKVFEENKIPIDYLAGTSMGAIVAAYYALYGEIEGLEKKALDFKKKDLFKLCDFNNFKISLVKGMKSREFLKTLFGDKTFSDVKIPLKIGATALEDGSKVVFTKGSILDAVIASSAFPGIFPAVEYDGKHLVDGGLADATPVDLVSEADVVVAVDLFDLQSHNARDYSKVVEVLSRTYEVIMSRLSDYKELHYKGNVILLKPQTGKGIHTFDFFLAKDNIKSGEDEARKHIAEIKEMIGMRS